SDIAVTELSTGLRYGAVANLPSGYTPQDRGNKSIPMNWKFGTSYVTGSHAFKTGFFLLNGIAHDDALVNQAISYSFLNRVPNSLTMWASPYATQHRITNMGLYAQDQWTKRRLTLNVGVRFDYFNGHTLANDVPAGRFVDARHFDPVENKPD